MKKVCLILAACFLLLGVNVQQSQALTFQFDQANSYVTDTTDPGLVMDWKNTPFTTNAFDLNLGDTYHFKFGSIGTTEDWINSDDKNPVPVTAHFAFLQPADLNSGNLTGQVQGWATWLGLAQGWNLMWNNPLDLTFANGTGLVEIALNDLHSFGLLDPNLGCTIYKDITGCITYESASSVPEPATMLLLGSGMMGLIGARKRFRKA